MDIRDAFKIQSAVNSGEISAREVAEAALQRIEAVDGKLGVFLTCDPARVLARADEIDRAVKRARFRSPPHRH
jgi:Asp-tRNA(Asn)/Glu-tRNA(Gln) amidotransferase A subunit family amidase